MSFHLWVGSSLIRDIGFVVLHSKLVQKFTSRLIKPEILNASFWNRCQFVFKISNHLLLLHLLLLLLRFDDVLFLQVGLFNRLVAELAQVDRQDMKSKCKAVPGKVASSKPLVPRVQKIKIRLTLN